MSTTCSLSFPLSSQHLGKKSFVKMRVFLEYYSYNITHTMRILLILLNTFTVYLNINDS